MWNNELNTLPPAQKASTKAKLARATYTQTQIYLKPLFRKLKSKKLPEDILDSLTIIIRHLLDRNYIMVSIRISKESQYYANAYRLLRIYS